MDDLVTLGGIINVLTKVEVYLKESLHPLFGRGEEKGFPTSD